MQEESCSEFLACSSSGNSTKLKTPKAVFIKVLAGCSSNLVTVSLSNVEKAEVEIAEGT